MQKSTSQERKKGFIPPEAKRSAACLKDGCRLALANNGVDARYKLLAGFTLLEMIISIGIFSVLVVAAVGVTLGVSNAQLKVAGIQATQDNIRYSVELMTKELRTGSQYQLSNFCPPHQPGEEISFFASNGRRRVYCLAGTTIMRLVDSIDYSRASPLLSEEVAVERLRFRVGGQVEGADDGQPWVTITLSIRSQGPKTALESQMDLQVTVTQRYRDQ